MFKKIWAWLKGAGHTIETVVAPTVVGILEGIKELFTSGAANMLATIADELTHSTLPTEAIAALNAKLPAILAAALGVENLPSAPTAEQIAAFEQALLAAFGIVDDKSKLYAVISADMFNVVQSYIVPGQKMTYADVIGMINTAFKKYQADIAAAPAAEESTVAATTTETEVAQPPIQDAGAQAEEKA